MGHTKHHHPVFIYFIFKVRVICDNAYVNRSGYETTAGEGKCMDTRLDIKMRVAANYNKQTTCSIQCYTGTGAEYTHVAYRYLNNILQNTTQLQPADELP